MAIWVTTTGQEMELPDDFNKEGLKALGWKKKRAPKRDVEAPQLDALQESNDD
jgi:hypothetical protein